MILTKSKVLCIVIPEIKCRMSYIYPIACVRVFSRKSFVCCKIACIQQSRSVCAQWFFTTGFYT